MRAWFRKLWTPRSTSVLICVFVFVGVITLRHLGRLQYLEFRAYDLFLNLRAEAIPADPRIVLIEVMEDDIRNPEFGGWPLMDGKLAEALSILAGHKPSVIGLDLFRDTPVPRDGGQIEALNNVLSAHSNIVCMWKFGDSYAPGVAPPTIVQSNLNRIGFGDFPIDAQIDKVVRRGLLYLDDGVAAFESLALRLVLAHLEKHGIAPLPDVDNPDHLLLGKTTFRPFERNDGAYVGADARGYQFLLDFKGPQRFRCHSLKEVFHNSIPPESLRDKIVMIGVATDTVKDYFTTPLEKDLWGVEVHAQAVNQLLRAALDGDHPIEVWSDFWENAWIFAWCVVGAAIGLLVRSPWRFSFCLIASVAAIATCAWLAFANGTWIPLVPPILACLPAAGLVVSYMSHQENQQRTQLMQVFSRHVSPDVARAIWEQRHEILEGNRPRSQKLTATVLFLDLQGFSGISERLEPVALMDWLNDCLGAMGKVVIDGGGIVEKYLGDGLLAIFGVPFPHTRPEEIAKDATMAVQCALAMEKELQRLNKQWAETGKPSAYMRIGIYTGPVVSGILGSAERMEYAVIGDTVNTASRLESYDKSTTDPEFDGRCGRILIGQSTLDLVGTRFDTKCVGSTQLKGKMATTTIHRVIRERAVHEN